MRAAPSTPAHLSPTSRGWRLAANGTVAEFADLEQTAAAIPKSAPLHLALPVQLALLERLTLPAQATEELAGMAQLQLEKTLPYPLEEATTAMEVIRHSENDSTVLSMAVQLEALERLCAPLRSNQKLPGRITLHAQAMAARCPAGEVVLALWMEHEHFVVGIVEDRKLGWAHAFPAAHAEAFEGELQGLLLSAELEGAPTAFSRALVSADCAQFEEMLQRLLSVPIARLEMSGGDAGTVSDLLPAAWALEGQQLAKGEELRKRLMTAAAVYLLLIAAAFVYLAIQKRRVEGVDLQIAALQPQIQKTHAQQKRWEGLAAAVDPSHSLVEVLFQVNKSRPKDPASATDPVRITQFNFSPREFKIDGEAPGAASAVEYVTKLKADKELAGFQITPAGPPRLTAKDHAQFSIFGKL